MMKSEPQQLLEYNTWKQDSLQRGYFFETERTDIINTLIDKYNYVNYLEIGVNDGNNIKRIKAEHIDGVDPGIEGKDVPETNYKITSDEFFNLIKDSGIKYDIIFIDGLHHDYQVLKDIQNALKHITDNGTIVCHDMNPRWELSTRREPAGVCWNGDCWKTWAQLRTTLTGYSMEVVDTDHGVGIIRKGEQTLLDNVVSDYWEMEVNRKEILNLITVEEFNQKYGTKGS